MAKYVLLPGDPARTEYIAKTYLDKPRVVSDFRGLLAYTGFYSGTRVSVFTTGMGCPSAGIVVEELSRLGAKTLIRVGTCGGVQKKVKPCDYIIPVAAVPLVGLLRAYKLASLSSRPDPGVLSALVRTAEKMNVRHWQGVICTSDAFYREVEQAKQWEKKGVLAFEMECAGIFALSRMLGLKTGAVLTATGNILYGTQVMETPEVRRAVKRMAEIALETIPLLEKKNG